MTLDRFDHDRTQVRDGQEREHPRPRHGLRRGGWAMLVCAGLVLPALVSTAAPAGAATNVDYSVIKVMGLGNSQISAPSPGVAAASGYGGAASMALDGAGNLYVSDRSNGVIEKITPSGTLSVWAGAAGSWGSPTFPMNLNGPGALTIDAAGSMYVVNSNASTISKINMTTGTTTVVAGTGTYTSSAVGLPTFGVAATATDFGDINDIAVDGAGNIFIADDANSIERVDHATGILTQIAGSSAGWNATGSWPTATPVTAQGAYVMGAQKLALAPDGSLYFTAFNGGTNAVVVLKLTSDGKVRRVAGSGAAGDLVNGSALATPIQEGMALRADAAGNLYLGTWHQVAQISPAGDLEVIAGIYNSTNSTAATFNTSSLSSTLFEVQALALSPDGSIYVDNSSPRYLEKLVNVQPGLPRAASATAGNATATVTWSAAFAGTGGAVTGYTITPYAAGVAQTPVSVSASTTTSTFPGLTNGTPYTFAVTATYASGSGDAATTLAVTPSAPAPSGGGGPALLPQTLNVSAPASVTLASGTARVGATASAGGAISYTSNTPSVVAVDAAGTVTLKAAGTASITVTAAATSTHLAATTTITFSVDAPASTSLPTGATRLSGPDRVATSVQVSQEIFADPDAGKSANVVIATSGGFADSIAGARLAGQVQGPLLLTGTDALDSAVASEVRRLVKKGGTVYILGQEKALSATVASALTSLSSDYSLQRLGGTDRYQTAVEIADEVTSEAGDTGPIYLVTGRDFADGVSVGAYAQRTGGVVLLTDGNVLPAATLGYLKSHDPTGARIVPVGGAAAAAATSAGFGTAASKAVVGVDRFDTSAKLATSFQDLKTAVSPQGKVNAVGVAGGSSWPDALAGSAAMAHVDGPLLLTPTGSGQLSDVTGQALQGLGGATDKAVVFGGPDAVSDAVLGALKKLVN